MNNNDYVLKQLEAEELCGRIFQKTEKQFARTLILLEVFGMLSLYSIGYGLDKGLGFIPFFVMCAMDAACGLFIIRLSKKREKAKKDYVKTLDELVSSAKNSVDGKGFRVTESSYRKFDWTALKFKSKKIILSGIFVLAALSLVFILYDGLKTFSFEKWRDKSWTRPFITDDLISQQASADEVLCHPEKYPYALCNMSRKEIKDIFYNQAEEIPLDIYVELCGPVSGAEYFWEAYYAYTDKFGGNHWLVFLYLNIDENPDNAKMLDLEVMSSGMHRKFGSSDYRESHISWY